jgi:hypothetical protein
MTELELRTFAEQLRQRDPRFLRVLEADADAEQGVYELRTAAGATGRAVFTFCRACGVQSPNFDEATRARLAEAATAAPNPYTAGLAALRASEATPSPAPSFEDTYKAERLRDLQAEYARAKDAR